MVAAIETLANGKASMFYKGAIPWHGLGTAVPSEKRLSVFDGLEASGLNWDAIKEALFLQDGTKVNDACAVIRQTDRRVLGVVGNRYTILQNKRAFEWFQPFLDAGVCEFHTAGSLYNGSKVWVLAKITGDNLTVTPGDEVEKYVLLSNSHDGTNAVRVGFTPIRTVCANTLAMAHNNKASKLIRARHTSKLEFNLTKIRETMDVINQEFNATLDQYKLLTTKEINQKDVRNYVKIIMGVDKKNDEDLSTRTKNVVDKICVMATPTGGFGQTLAPNTMWSAYNAVTQYLSHTACNTANNRYASLWYGQNYNVNKHALDIAIQMAGGQECAAALETAILATSL